MFSSKCNYPKLKTNLRLTVNRLKLLEKKKTELALKSRKEIADYIQAGKEDRARIRVEHIVREDYMVEGMEILEMFCDLLLARFGIIERVSSMDPTIEEAIASIIWAEPRLSADIPELQIISKNLMARYGKEYHAACKTNQLNTVNDKLIRKMSIYSPPKMLIENYMVEIAKSFNVEFQPDPLALLGEDGGIPLDDLLGFGDMKPGGGPPPPPSQPPSGGGGGGGFAYPQPGAGYPPAGAYPSPGASHGGPPPPSGPGDHGAGGFTSPTGSMGGGFPTPSNFPAQDPNYPPPVPSLPPSGPASMPSPYGSQPPSGGFNIPPNIPPEGSAGGDPSFKYHPSEMKSPGGPPDQQRPPVYTQAPTVDRPPNYSSLDMRNDLSTPPAPGGSSAPPEPDMPSLPEIPSDDLALPSVPSSTNPGAGGGGNASNSNDIDFDDLAARFENLKKRK